MIDPEDISEVLDLVEVIGELVARREWDFEAHEPKAGAARPDREVDCMSDETPAEWWDIMSQPLPGEDFDAASLRVRAADAVAEYLRASRGAPDEVTGRR